MKTLSKIWSLVWLCLLAAQASMASTPNLPKSSWDFANEQLRFESATKVSGIEILWVNYSALRRDFKELVTLTDAQIDLWIDDSFGYVSDPQLKMVGIRNTAIPTVNRGTKIIRPFGWDRSFVIPAKWGEKTIGMVDLKGSGLPEQRTKFFNHSVEKQLEEFANLNGNPESLEKFRSAGFASGLLEISEAVTERIRQMVLQIYFDNYRAKFGSKAQTVENYFAFAYPFQSLSGTDLSTAVAYGRQAHLGRKYIPANSPEALQNFPVSFIGFIQTDNSYAIADFGDANVHDQRIQDLLNERPEPAVRKFLAGDKRAISNFLAKIAERAAKIIPMGSCADGLVLSEQLQR